MGQMLLRIDGTRNKLLPYLRQNKRHMDHQSIDGVRNKSVSKNNNKDIVGMEDIERSLPFNVHWKVALSKRNLSLF